METRDNKDQMLLREVYALLHLCPKASDEDVKKAYRQWAQVYHLDKHQTVQNMKKSQPGLSFTNTGKVLGDKWKKMLADDKVPFEAKAKVDKARYS